QWRWLPGSAPFGRGLAVGSGASELKGLSELSRRPVAQAAVRPPHVVVQAPGFEDDRRLTPTHEESQVQALIPQLPVEALAVGVLPGAARIDVTRPRAPNREP